MSELPTIPTDIGVKELLLNKMPEITKSLLEKNNAQDALSNTEISMMIDTGTDSVTYILKDGKDISVTEGAIENAMLKLKIDNDDLEKMIKSNNLDMILGIQSDININKYNALKSLKGSFTAEISDEADTIKLDVMLNGESVPHTTFKMSMQDSSALMRKETNPIQLFMSGALRIDGDMAFAMSTQPLFS